MGKHFMEEMHRRNSWDVRTPRNVSIHYRKHLKSWVNVRSTIRLLNIAQLLLPDVPARKLLKNNFVCCLFNSFNTLKSRLSLYWLALPHRRPSYKHFGLNPLTFWNEKSEKVSPYVSKLILKLKISQVREPCCEIVTSKDLISGTWSKRNVLKCFVVVFYFFILEILPKSSRGDIIFSEEKIF